MKIYKVFAYEHVNVKVNGKFERKQKWLTLKPAGVKFDKDLHFLEHTESDYLAVMLKGLPYATFKTDDMDEMEHFIAYGHTHPVTGTVWRSVFAHCDDQEGSAFMCPEEFQIDSLEKIGIFTFMKDEGDVMKVAKYVKRLLASILKTGVYLNTNVTPPVVEYYGGPVWGEQVGWKESDQEAIVKIDQQPGENLSEQDRMLSIRYVDLKELAKEIDGKRKVALCDGCLTLSNRAVRLLNLSASPKMGMAWRVTAGTEQLGVGKGHAVYLDHQITDIVIYGPKTQVRTSRFFFGRIAELHVGKPHTDRQAYVNFQYRRDGLAIDLARDFMMKILAVSEDEGLLRRLLLSYLKDGELTGNDKDSWILRDCLTYGISYLRFPGLYSRVYQYLLTKVMACERSRIPMDTVAMYAYVLPTPKAIGPYGDIDLAGAIPKGTIVCPDLPAGTQVICHRQPSENSNAWVILTVIHIPDYDVFAGKGVCFIGWDALEILGRLGGGDMDDQFIIIHDPRWVAAFQAMRPYPETDKVQDLEVVPDLDAEFTDQVVRIVRSTDYTRYTNQHVSKQIDMANNYRAGIGVVVNFGAIDMLMSDPDEKASMLDDLRKNRNRQGFTWLKNREDYQADWLMTNLERVIDASVKDSALMGPLDDRSGHLGGVSGMINDFHKKALVYPESMKDRVPKSRRERAKKGQNPYFTAKSLTCKSLEHIANLRKGMERIFRQREIALAVPADPALLKKFPYDAEVAFLLKGHSIRDEEGNWVRTDSTISVMDMWSLGWKKWRESPEKGRDTMDVAYVKICNVLELKLQNETKLNRVKLAVQLYYEKYKKYGKDKPVRRGEHGDQMPYGDALLWSPVFAPYFISALKMAKLNGYYHPVKIDRLHKELMGKVVTVQVRSGVVYIQNDRDEYKVDIGTILTVTQTGQSIPDTIPGKEPLMDNGMIEFVIPQSICLPDEGRGKIIAQAPVRIFPSNPVRHVEPKKKEPSSDMAILLKAAAKLMGLDKK